MSTQPSERSSSTSAMQAVSRATEHAMAGLRDSPVLLALVWLNALGIGAALWFLGRMNAHNAALVKLILTACLPKPT